MFTLSSFVLLLAALPAFSAPAYPVSANPWTTEDSKRYGYKVGSQFYDIPDHPGLTLLIDTATNPEPRKHAAMVALLDFTVERLADWPRETLVPAKPREDVAPEWFTIFHGWRFDLRCVEPNTNVYWGNVTDALMGFKTWTVSQEPKYGGMIRGQLWIGDGRVSHVTSTFFAIKRDPRMEAEASSATP